MTAIPNMMPRWIHVASRRGRVTRHNLFRDMQCWQSWENDQTVYCLLSVLLLHEDTKANGTWFVTMTNSPSNNPLQHSGYFMYRHV